MFLWSGLQTYPQEHNICFVISTQTKRVLTETKEINRKI